MPAIIRHTFLLSCIIVSTLAGSAWGQKRDFAAVPPTLEIEVLDPGVDPLGNPAVTLKNGAEGRQIVDIPPVVLVHRYYYSGDRSFQGPMLPGGPSILVANHPKTGERLYVPAQMMPGAPRVTYTKRGITYDYGKHATMLEFSRIGSASVKYRNGLTWRQKVQKVLHTEEIAEHFEGISQNSKGLAERGKTVLMGATADLATGAKTALIPVTNLAQSLPFGKIAFSGDLETHFAESAAQFQRDRANTRAERQAKLDELTLPTNR